MLIGRTKVRIKNLHMKENSKIYSDIRSWIYVFIVFSYDSFVNS